MPDPIEGNPEAQAAADTSTAGNIESIMGSMAGDNGPEAKPDAAADGKKAEGTTETGKGSSEDYPAWTSQLPEEIRGNADAMKQLSKFAKIGELAKSYSELESKLGKSIVQPGEDASEEEVNAFYEKLGKPKTADKYSIDVEGSENFKKLAYENNLSDKQAVAIFNSLRQIGQQTLQQQQQETLQHAKETTEALQAEYGNNFDLKMKMLAKGVETYGGKELGNKLKNTGLLFDRDVVKMFILLGEQASEPGSFNKGTGKANDYKSRADGGTFSFKDL